MVFVEGAVMKTHTSRPHVANFLEAALLSPSTLFSVIQGFDDESEEQDFIVQFGGTLTEDTRGLFVNEALASLGRGGY